MLLCCAAFQALSVQEVGLIATNGRLSFEFGKHSLCFERHFFGSYVLLDSHSIHQELFHLNILYDCHPLNFRLLANGDWLAFVRRLLFVCHFSGAVLRLDLSDDLCGGLRASVFRLCRFHDLRQTHHSLFVTHVRLPHELLLLGSWSQSTARAKSLHWAAISNQIFVVEGPAEVFIV